MRGWLFGDNKNSQPIDDYHSNGDVCVLPASIAEDISICGEPLVIDLITTVSSDVVGKLTLFETSGSRLYVTMQLSCPYIFKTNLDETNANYAVAMYAWKNLSLHVCNPDSSLYSFMPLAQTNFGCDCIPGMRPCPPMDFTASDAPTTLYISPTAYAPQADMFCHNSNDFIAIMAKTNDNSGVIPWTRQNCAPPAPSGDLGSNYPGVPVTKPNKPGLPAGLEGQRAPPYKQYRPLALPPWAPDGVSLSATDVWRLVSQPPPVHSRRCSSRSLLHLGSGASQLMDPDMDPELANELEVRSILQSNPKDDPEDEDLSMKKGLSSKPQTRPCECDSRAFCLMRGGSVSKAREGRGPQRSSKRWCSHSAWVQGGSPQPQGSEFLSQITNVPPAGEETAPLGSLVVFDTQVRVSLIHSVDAVFGDRSGNPGIGTMDALNNIANWFVMAYGISDATSFAYYGADSEGDQRISFACN
eukprot:gene24059-9632_t